jgi:uncharacterized protein YcbX
MQTTAGLRIRDLYIYPLKSAAGIRLESAALDVFGLAGDRRWMVIDDKGKFLSQRELPRLALLRVEAQTPALILAAPGMERLVVPIPEPTARIAVTIWDDACEALDAGDEAAEWLRTCLQVACRLVYASDDMMRGVDPRYAHGDERVAFSDGFPLLLIGQGSLDDLNARLTAAGRAAAPMNRFRPNVVIEGAPAFAEDQWRRLAIEVSGAPAIHLDIVKPCPRCSIVPVDQDTGVRGTEPLTTLASYRRRDGKVFFGQNVLHRDRGVLRVGAPVVLLE